MHYVGGKAKIAKKIANAISGYRRDTIVEPFCGACWMTTELAKLGPVIASDANRELIAMWQALQNGWVPPDFVSESEYLALKNDPTAPPELRAFVGFGCSYRGKLWDGYAWAASRDYILEAHESVLKKVVALKNVTFKACSYLDIDCSNCLVYCDPPYAGTTDPYGADFEGDFWQWARDLAKTNTVFVSEYTAPDFAIPIWQADSKVTLAAKSGKRVEKLFLVR